MSYLSQLIDKRRTAEAALYGVNMEIAMAQNQREDAHYWKDLMYAAIKARKADPEGCFFLEQGDKDHAKVAG